MLTINVQRIVCTFLVLVLACGCTARDLYGAAQDYQRQQCRSGPPSEYDVCMERANESYDTYQQKKKEVEEGRHHNSM